MLLPKRKRTLLPDPMSVVSRFVEAANRHDADGIEACLHPDFESIQPIHPSRNFRGARQVRRNWQAIFDVEPGFRLTVLRGAASQDTAWVELHGAGQAAEVAGVLIFGVQDGRLRWSRIYSELVEQPVLPTDGTVEPVPAAAEEPEATLAVDDERPVFEVIHGEKYENRRAAPAAGDGQPGDGAVAADEAVDTEAVATEAAATEASPAPDDVSETLVESDVGVLADESESPEAETTLAEAATGIPDETNANGKSPEVELVEVTPAKGAKPKRSSRARKGKAASTTTASTSSTPAKPRRTRKKST